MRGASGTSLTLPDRQSRNFLVILTSVMVFLATLAVAGALAVDNIIDRWNQDVKGSMTVQVLVPDISPPEEARKNLGNQVDQVVALLHQEPAVGSVEVLGEEHLKRLLNPWMGDVDSLSNLPLPRLISLTLKPGQTLDVDNFQARLKAVAPDALLEDHQQWLGRLVSLARGISAVAWGSLILVSITVVVAVVQATKSALIAQWPTIELLHLIGAQDRYIARQFDRKALWVGFLGGLLGLFFALPALMLVGYLAHDLEGGLLPGLRLHATDWAVIAILPFLAGLLALLTTRWSVLRTLARLL